MQKMNKSDVEKIESFKNNNFSFSDESLNRLESSSTELKLINLENSKDHQHGLDAKRFAKYKTNLVMRI